MERTLTSEFQHGQFSIQLDRPTFGSSNIIVAYVIYYTPSIKFIIDEVLLSTLKVKRKVRQFFSLVSYLKKHDIPLGNITTVAADSAPTMVGRNRKFATLS